MYARVHGPAFVVTEASPDLIEAASRPLLGMPISEAYPEKQYQPVLDLMDWVAMTGAIAKVTYQGPDGRSGVLTLRPVEDGLEIVWRPARLAALRPCELADRVARRVLHLPALEVA